MSAQIKKHFHRRSRNLPLGVKIWLLFAFFILIVFILMWLFQIVFLQQFYEMFKTRDTQRIAGQLSSAYLENDNFEETAENLALQNEMCLEILNPNGYEDYQFCVMDERCLLHGHNSGLYFFLSDIINSDDGTISRKMVGQVMDMDTLLYGCTLYTADGDVAGYLFVSTQLEPVASTTSILRRQTGIIVVLLAIVGVIISLLMARYISRPLARITRGAKRLAHRDYSVTFTGGGYAEVNDLAETLTVATRELSKTDQMQHDLIANVSHDLRTPLTMIKAYAEMIRDLTGDNPEKRAQNLNTIIEETDRLSLLVSDMLDLSKLESGTQKLDYSTFEIWECLESIVARWAGLSEKMGYQIHLIYDGAPPRERYVHCDEGKINRVIGNLISNAINYTNKENKEVFVTMRNLSDAVRIEVRDTGDGIPSDQIGLIFQQYYRSENHQRSVVGTGLGLSIVSAILKLHGYNYGVQSKRGKGSIFWFEIPSGDIVPTPPAETLSQDPRA